MSHLSRCAGYTTVFNQQLPFVEDNSIDQSAWCDIYKALKERMEVTVPGTQALKNQFEIYACTHGFASKTYNTCFKNLIPAVKHTPPMAVFIPLQSKATLKLKMPRDTDSGSQEEFRCMNIPLGFAACLDIAVAFSIAPPIQGQVSFFIKYNCVFNNAYAPQLVPVPDRPGNSSGDTSDD